MSEQTHEDAQARVARLERELAEAKRQATLDVEGEGNVVASGGISDSVASTGSIEAREGSVVIIAREVAGDFVRSLKPQRLSAADLQAITEPYLKYLITRYRYLDFRGMGMADRVPLRLPLEEMYVPLKAHVSLPRYEVPRDAGWLGRVRRWFTPPPPPPSGDAEGQVAARDIHVAGRLAGEEEAAAMGERVSAPVPLVDLLARHDGLVILGDPGAGKTTFLKHLTVRLALGQGDTVGLAGRLPVLVPLSAYAKALDPEDISLQDWLAAYYHKQGLELSVDQLLEAALAEGRALVMFDGLDEVQELTQRGLVFERVANFYALHRQLGNKFILTSRIVGYKEVRLSAEGLEEVTLVDFDEQDIRDFVDRWTRAVEQAALGASQVSLQQAAIERTELLDAVARNLGVRQLAANPLLLTILALMKRQGVTLPERRVELYDKYVETLLRHWNLARGLDRRAAHDLDRRAARDLDVVETLRVMAPLALWMQETSPGRGLVKQAEMHRQLLSIYAQRGEADPEQAARRFQRDVHDHAGLLLERGPREYGFIHLTFQEYLAAVAIAQQGQQDVAPITRMLAKHAADANWHEVALLTVGYVGLIQQREQAAGDVVQQLVSMRNVQPAHVLLAGEAAADAGREGVSAAGRQAVAQALLATMLDDARVDAPTRAAAGGLLARLGDPRPGVGCVVRDGVAVPDIDWVTVEPWPFIIGDGSDKFTCRLITQPYRISRYPITVAQYATFIQARGYEQQRWWTKSRWRWRTMYGIEAPGQYSAVYQTLNHPQVGVSWYEAAAYCAWLSEQLGYEVRLPTEAEWERAARHTDGRAYPWGNKFEPSRCNMRDTGIGATSAVGIFARGNAECGAADMVGNVWEWCQTKYHDGYDNYEAKVDDSLVGEEDRVRRGGAFDNSELLVRCAYRASIHPDARHSNLGFRVVSPRL